MKPSSKYYAFISYSHHDDIVFVENLHKDCEAILQARLSRSVPYIWRDLTDMPSQGRSFRTEIRDAIDSSDHVMLIVSPKAMASPEVQMEYDYALSICKPVIPVLRLGEWSLLPEAFANFEGFDFREDALYTGQLSRLLKEISTEPFPLGKLVNVPAAPAQFQPRPTYTMTIKDELLRDTTKPVVITSPRRISGMQGLGGIGKSVLAADLARNCDVRSSYPDGIIWVNLGETPNIVARLEDACRALGDEREITRVDSESGKARLSQLIADKACLLILDDVWKIEHAKAFNFTSPRSSLLITTRIAGILDEMGVVPHRIEVLSEVEALQLMARHLSST